jgi:hypothetical protein
VIRVGRLVRLVSATSTVRVRFGPVFLDPMRSDACGPVRSSPIRSGPAGGRPRPASRRARGRGGRFVIDPSDSLGDPFGRPRQARERHRQCAHERPTPRPCTDARPRRASRRCPLGRRPRASRPADPGDVVRAVRYDPWGHRRRGRRGRSSRLSEASGTRVYSSTRSFPEFASETLPSTDLFDRAALSVGVDATRADVDVGRTVVRPAAHTVCRRCRDGTAGEPS